MSSFSKSLIKTCIWTNLILVPFCVSAQNDSSGIFMNTGDFLNNRLTYQAACSNENNKVSFRGKVIKIKIQEGSQKRTYKLKNDKVFGLKTCKNTYRFQGGLEYKVINTKYIPLYSRTVMSGGDGAFYDEVYYFSIKPEGEIQRLTKAALKEAYSSNSEFVNYIETVFKNDYELNSQLNPYMLIYFFEQFKK
jgi:hypothetical protein